MIIYQTESGTVENRYFSSLVDAKKEARSMVQQFGHDVEVSGVEFSSTSKADWIQLLNDGVGETCKGITPLFLFVTGKEKDDGSFVCKNSVKL